MGKHSRFCRHGFISALLCLMIILPLHAEPPDEAALDRLYELSGMEIQFATLPETMRDAFLQGIAMGPDMAIPEERLAALGERVAGFYAPADFRAAVEARLRQDMEADEVEEVLAWLESPLGRRVTAVEEAAVGPDAYEKSQAYASALEEGSVPEERVALLKKLDEAVNLTETSVEIGVHAQLAAALAANAVQPPEQRLEPQQVMAIVEGTRGMIEAMTREQVLLSLLYTYQDLSEAELQGYIGFATSPAGNTFNRLVSEAMSRTFVEKSGDLGEVLGELVRELGERSAA